MKNALKVLFVVGALLVANNARAFSFTPYGLGTMPDGRVFEAYQITFDPGEGFPWHYHGGELDGVVVSGTLTQFHGCGEPDEVYTTGQAFTEEPGVVHEVINNGNVPVSIVFTGVLPSCFNEYVDTVLVDGPVCSGNHAKTDKVPSCDYLTSVCTVNMDLGAYQCPNKK